MHKTGSIILSCLECQTRQTWTHNMEIGLSFWPYQSWHSRGDRMCSDHLSWRSWSNRWNHLPFCRLSISHFTIWVKMTRMGQYKPGIHCSSAPTRSFWIQMLLLLKKRLFTCSFPFSEGSVSAQGAPFTRRSLHNVREFRAIGKFKRRIYSNRPTFSCDCWIQRAKPLNWSSNIHITSTKQLAKA